jgi:hypothetical protein
MEKPIQLSYKMITDNRSVPRKEIDASFSWEKHDGYYASVDLMSRVNSMLLFSLSYDLYEVNFPYISKSRIKKYLELRRLPNTEGVGLVDEDDSCYSNIESVVIVRSVGEKTWKKENYNRVSINNLVGESESLERKINSIMNIKVVCPCIRSTFIRSCRVPIFQRKIFNDNRMGNDVPGSFVDSEFCKHALVAMDYVTTFDGAANFGFFGIYANRTIEVSNQVIEYVLKKGLKYSKEPDCDVNKRLNKKIIDNYGTYLSYWSEPLRKLIFHRQQF